MNQRIKTFFAAHTITTHSIVAFCVVMVTAYNQVPVFQTYVLHLYASTPVWLHNLLEAILAIVAWYWRGRPIWTTTERKEMAG
jgi:hypothetical protein